jgi:hypothetical protein
MCLHAMACGTSSLVRTLSTLINQCSWAITLGSPKLTTKMDEQGKTKEQQKRAQKKQIIKWMNETAGWKHEDGPQPGVWLRRVQLRRTKNVVALKTKTKSQ